MKIGIEHEFVFKDSSNNYIDFTNSSYNSFKQIVDEFPAFKEDEKIFECKSLETKPKRCYIEGFEKYDLDNNILETIPKGLEIRTPPFEEVNEILDNFTASFKTMSELTSSVGLSPLLVSYNPFQDKESAQKYFEDEPHGKRSKKELSIAKKSMVTHGMHLNISFENKMDLKDILEKLYFYSPYIIPFSFSSPFCNNNLFGGLCYRNYINKQLVSLRKRNNVDTIQFRGFDAIGDLDLLKSLLLLIKAIILENELKGRSKKQDLTLVELSCIEGFSSKIIKNGIMEIIEEIKNYPKDNLVYLDSLRMMIDSNDSYAVKMKQDFRRTNNIVDSISNRYIYI